MKCTCMCRTKQLQSVFAQPKQTLAVTYQRSDGFDVFKKLFAWLRCLATFIGSKTQAGAAVSRFIFHLNSGTFKVRQGHF